VETVVQVSVPNRNYCAVVCVREGMLLSDMLDHLPPMPENAAKLIVGGPLMGHALHDLQVPLTQQTDSIMVQTAEEISGYTHQACMSCGFCVRHCPVGLMPNELSKYCEYGRFDLAEKNDLFACIECGICAYVCPVKRPMVHLLRFGKHEVMLAREMM
jgi:electron transport complex protein RnfC